jgi:hypothetical protein
LRDIFLQGSFIFVRKKVRNLFAESSCQDHLQTVSSARHWQDILEQENQYLSIHRDRLFPLSMNGQGTERE